MNLPYFISKRISSGENKSFSSTIHKIAIGSIGLGLAVMIVSFMILKGFQETVIGKIFDFSSHFLVTKYSYGSSYEEPPMNFNTALYNNYGDYEYIDHIQEYAHKAGLIKTDEDILGVVFKGVGTSFDKERFNDYMVEGEFIDFPETGYSKDILISKSISDKLNLTIGDELIIHFFQDPPRSRKLTVKGIYETNLSEYYDDRFIIGDINLIRRLNNWGGDIAGGFEVFIKDGYDLDKAHDLLNSAIEHNQYAESTRDKFGQIFEWLNLIRRQVNIFLTIILFVVCINMISIILILIMERTQMIGTLKAIGSDNLLIRRIFSYSGIQLVIKGLLWGNGIGIGFGLIQYFFEIIKLNPHDYYMKVVPIGWNWEMILLLNLLTFIIVSLILFLPTAIITRINPIKSIKFD